MTEDKGRWSRFLEGNRTLLLAAVAGAILLMLPTGKTESAGARFDTEEEKLAEVLSGTEGAGRVKVLLREERGGEYRGVVVVCEGADRAEVRLRLVKAVSAFTGLGANEIIVLKMEE